jgi:hypothetical protein
MTLENVTSNNYKRIPIHAIVVGHDVSEWFPKELASRNQGTYVRIEH